MESDFEKKCDTSAVTEPQADTLFQSVLNTSYKTIICLFLFTLLSVSYFFMRFPYHTMNIYMDFSMYKNALAYCERSVNALKDDKKHKDMYVESLLNGIELSNMLLIDCAQPEYAKKLIKYSQVYAADPDFGSTNSRLDEFYLDQIYSGVSGISLYNALDLYSYKDFVYSRNYYARVFTNQSDKILFDGSVIDVSSITAQMLSQMSPSDLAVFFNQIALCPNLKNYDAIYDAITVAAGSHLNYCVNNAAETEGIERLYLIKAANNIYRSLKQQFGDKAAQTDAIFSIDGQDLQQYLAEQLEQYITSEQYKTIKAV